ncbi:hypothetical protein BDY24DRAFT_141983 [Mrakia frigida]|uniref:uncharacterized protein n=1 Tax=Mrakia frigida TaxID=29902 RepID=UPI003FCC10CA
MVNPPALILLESLPLPALEGIISSLLLTSPSLTIPFLSEMGSILSEATSRVLYKRLRIVLPALVWGLEGRGEGETKVEWKERRRWQVVLSNPNRYASSVKEISVYPPSNPHASSHGSLAATPVNQGEEDIFLALLQVCASSVERIEWRGVGVWGEGVSQQLLSLPVLQHLSLLPPPLHPSSLSTQYHPSSIPRFHLPHPIPQSLRTLALSRLSPMGAKNFASHITNLPGHSPLDKVSVDSALFDDQLAENLSEAGRGVKEVWIRTTGTKLTDVGLSKLFEGCVDLERLTLSEVQGRFSKSIWMKIDFPETFKHLRVEISDVGPHHSWSLDHLLSIPSVQLSNLQTLSITRSTPPFSLFPVPPLGHEPPPPDDVCVVKPIPEALYEALLAEGTGLRVLELDWWEVSSDQVSKLAKTLTNLEKFKFELDAPFSKLLLLTTPFSSLTRLHTLHVIIQTQHLPLPSAAPTSSSIPPHTPSSSPTISKSSLRSENQQHAVPNNATGNPSPPVSLSDLQSPPGEELHPVLLAKSIDPTIPLLRDVRKFVRRVPRLVELGWVGRGGSFEGDEGVWSGRRWRRSWNESQIELLHGGRRRSNFDGSGSAGSRTTRIDRFDVGEEKRNVHVLEHQQFRRRSNFTLGRR